MWRPTLTGAAVRRTSTGAESSTIGAKVGSDARGNLLTEATGKGYVEITMPRGFDHRTRAAHVIGSPKWGLI